MKRLTRPAIIIGVSLLIALSSAAITYTAKISSLGYSTTASLLLQTTPTPKVEEDRSEVGSTDKIVIMGGVITLIVLIPILTQRKAWMRTE
jgi:hypothetical protein